MAGAGKQEETEATEDVFAIDNAAKLTELRVSRDIVGEIMLPALNINDELIVEDNAISVGWNLT